MALPPGFVLEQPKVNLPPGFVLETTPEAPPEKQSFMRQVADVPLGVAKGAVQGIRMIADAFGAGSETSNTIKGAEQYLAGLMSAEAKKDQAEIARIMKDAEDKGVLDQVKAGLQAFATAPVDTLSQALGTAAPVIVGALGAKILGAGALVSTGLGVATGAGMGAGVIKGSIYEETKKALIEAGADPKVAEQKAQQAQEYGGKNLDQILLGTVLGGVAAAGPLEKGGAAILARRILGKAGVEEAGEATAEAAAKGALRRRAEAGALEAVPEAVQAGQEQVAQNIALQREGFDIPTMRGVAGAATLEGLAGAGLGATVGGGKPEVRPPTEEKPVEPPAAEAPPAIEPPPIEPPAEPQIAEPTPTPEETTQERLMRLQKEIDENAREIAELNRRQGMPSPDRLRAPIEERPSMAEQVPQPAPREELLAKQAEVDRARLEAGLPTGEASETPGIQPTPEAVVEPKPVPKIVDNRPLEERAAKNRLLVMQNMLKNQGGDPASLTIIPHPTAKGRFAIQSLDVPTKFTKGLPETAITRPESPKIIDPVEAYVETQRRTNTPAARRFVSDFESGRITREDVEKALEQERKAGEPQPLTYTATGEPGIIAAPSYKPRGERFLPPAPPPPPPPPPPAPPPPPLPPPSTGMPTTLEEFKERMPIDKDKPEVRAANNAGDFKQLTSVLRQSKNPAVKRIGELGSGIADKITLKTPKNLGPGVGGIYRYADDSIRMSPAYAGSEWVNAHETLHALIAKAQRFPSDRQKPVVEKIEKLYQHVKKELKKKGVTAYGLTNALEFTAEAMSNPEFQFELMQIPYAGKKSAWTAFVQAVADLLGIQNTNALTEVMNLVDRLAEMKQPRKKITERGMIERTEERAIEQPPLLDTTGLKVIKGRDPQVQAAAQLLQQGKLTREEFEQYVNYYTPIQTVDPEKLRPPSTEEAMRGAVASNKANLVNQPIADGTKVGLRLDIPSTRAGVPTVSVHEGAAGKASQGKAKSYTSTAYITNATFESRSQKTGLDIAVGAGKEPLQTVEGTWVNEDPQSVFEKVKKLLKDPNWTQVGFDPTRHGYFYDRETGDPVVSASEVYQIGTLLVAKDVKYAPKEGFLYSMAETKEEKPSLKERIIEAGREAGQKRKLDTGAFEGVDEGLVKSLEPTFAPRNVTVQDRILGMRDNFWQRMAQGIADQYRTIKEYSEEAYMKARLSKTVDGGLEGLMFYGQVFNDGGALNIKQNTRGMFDVLKPVGKELDRYLIWVALNREASLPADKRSINPDLVARRNELSDGNISGKSRKEVYEQVQRDMNALNRSVLKVALDAGLLNTTEGAIKDIEANEKLSPEEKREKIAELRKNPIGYERFINDLNYIPFYRVMEEGDTDSVSKAVSATGLTSQYFSKALKGGEKPFGDLMENTLRNWNHILSAAMKNQAAVATVEAAVKVGAAKPNLKPGLEMRDGKVYSIMSDEIVGDGSVRPELTEAGKGTVKVVVDGKNAHYEVTDPLLLDSITSIGYLGPQSKFLDVARDFKNILQFGVTISPQFKVNNLIRDSVSAMGVSELKKNPIANVLEGVSLSDRNSPTYIAAMAGGAVFNFGTAYEGDQSRLIKRLLKMGVDRDHILDSKDKITAGLRYAWDKYQEWGNKSEAANRLALYKQLRDGGMSHLEASFKARDLLDFSMQGSWPAFRVLTQVIPFLNARVQGLYKLGRDGIIPTARVINNTVTGKPTDATDRQKAQQFMIVSSAVMLASALLYLTFKDDEEYKRRDEWDKDNFWWFRLPGMDFALRVPKPFEIGALGTLVERTLEQILDSGAEGKQFGDAVKRTLGSTFALNPIPQMFKPLVDIYANKDAFTGAPIESAGLERLSKQERMINTTSPLAIALGKVSTLFPEAMELSPVQADYLIKGYFGWLGATAATTSMYATMPFNEGEYPDARWMDRLSLGLARELPGRGAKYVTAFYESNKEISQAFADMRHYAEMGDSEKVQKILEEKGDKIQLAKFYDKTAKTMANIRKQVRVVQNDKDMDGAAKKEEIDRLNDLISTLAKQAEEVRKSMKP